MVASGHSRMSAVCGAAAFVREAVEEHPVALAAERQRGIDGELHGALLSY
jgi:hypothetical protein